MGSGMNGCGLPWNRTCGELNWQTLRLRTKVVGSTGGNGSCLVLGVGWSFVYSDLVGLESFFLVPFDQRYYFRVFQHV